MKALFPAATRPYWILFILVSISLSAASQELDIRVHPEYYFDFYELGKEKGLRSNLPYNLIQDQKGYIWLVADEWIQRYNGKHFETFFKVPAHRDRTTTLIEDHEGKIWVFRFFPSVHSNEPVLDLDVWCIDPETGAVTDAAAIWEKKAFDFALNDISAIGHTGTGNNRRVLLGIKDGRTVSIGPQTKTLFHISDESLITILTGNSRGDIAVAWKNTLVLLDSTGQQLAARSWEHLISSISLSDDREVFLSKLVQKNGVLKGESALFDGNNWQLSPYTELNEEMDDLVPWRVQNDSFLVSENKIIRKGDLSVLFECEKCPRLFLDRQNNIWTTHSNGIMVIRVQPRLFQTLLSGRHVETRGILPISDSTLIVHSYRGAFRVDLQDSILDHNANMKAMIGIDMDAQGRIWEGVHGWYIGYVPDYKTQLAAREIWDSTLIREGNNVIIPLAGEEGLWGGARLGLLHCPWDGENAIKNCVQVDHPILRRSTVTYLERSDTALWAATSAGLFQIDPKRREVVKYFDQLHELNINHFTREDSTFWLSTYYNGLIKWKLGAAEFEQIPLSTEEDPLGIPSLCAVYDDGLGFLWMPSISGLYRLRKSDHFYKRYNRHQNLAHEEFNYHSHARMPDNRFIFGGLNGLTVVDPERVEQLDRKAPLIPLIISDVSIDDGSTSEKITIGNGHTVTIRGQRDILKLNCHLLDFRNLQPGQIIYKVEGMDSEWQLLEGETMRLERLPYGRFTLKIRAVATDKFSKTEFWTVTLISRKPWYRTNLALGALLVLVLGAGRGIFKFRFRAIEKANLKLEATVRQRTAELEANRNRILEQNESLKSLNDYKSKIMAIMGHDLRGPILGLSNLGGKMKYLLERGEMERVFTICRESERQIDHLRILIDNLLVWSLLQDDHYLKIKKTETNLWAIAATQIKVLERASASKGISLLLEGDREVSYDTDPFVLGILIRNLIANSIRYGPADETVSIRILVKSTIPVIEIEDRGPGISKSLRDALNRGKPLISPYRPGSQEGLGLGLWICSSLVPKLHGRWSFETPAGGKGLLVSLELLGENRKSNRFTYI